MKMKWGKWNKANNIHFMYVLKNPLQFPWGEKKDQKLIFFLVWKRIIFFYLDFRCPLYLEWSFWLCDICAALVVKSQKFGFWAMQLFSFSGRTLATPPRTACVHVYACLPSSSPVPGTLLVLYPPVASQFVFLWTLIEEGTVIILNLV